MKYGTIFRLALACAPVLAASELSAQALGLASPYNVFVLGNMTESNVDATGRVAVGGNASLTNYGVGSSFSSNPSSAGNSLVVGGNLSYNGGEVHYGNVIYGGNLYGSVSAPNGTVSRSQALDFAGIGSYLTFASGQWSGLAANGSVANPYGGIRLVGTDPKLNVFNVSGAMLASTWGVAIDAPTGSTVLVNVDGSAGAMRYFGMSFSDLNGDGSGVTDKQHVIYNFHQATSLNIDGISVLGTVLAPHAAVTFGNGNIEGNLIAGSLTGNGEAHNYLFNGSLPAATVPEPAVPILAALAAAVALGRRRRA